MKRNCVPGEKVASNILRCACLYADLVRRLLVFEAGRDRAVLPLGCCGTRQGWVCGAGFVCVFALPWCHSDLPRTSPQAPVAA